MRGLGLYSSILYFTYGLKYHRNRKKIHEILSLKFVFVSIKEPLSDNNIYVNYLAVIQYWNVILESSVQKQTEVHLFCGFCSSALAPNLQFFGIMHNTVSQKTKILGAHVFPILFGPKSPNMTTKMFSVIIKRYMSNLKIVILRP